MGLNWDSFLNSLSFTREPSNPILVRGGNGEWDEAVLADPTIIEEATELRMYYSANGDDGSGGAGYATSPKTYPPITWTKQGKVFAPNPIPSQWDSGWLRMGSIFKLDGVYYLYYSATPSTAQTGTEQIGLATSNDGITFTRSGSNPILPPSDGETNTINPAVIKVGSTWYMYYANRVGSAETQYKVATSSDGVSWTKIGVVLSVGAGGQWDDTKIEHCSIYYLFDHYVLVYEGYGGSGAEPWAEGLAYSSDPTATFTKYSGNPFFQKSGVVGQFDRYHVATPSFFIKSDIIYLFFQGGNAYYYGDCVWDIGLAESPSRDIVKKTVWVIIGASS
jgi:predicted GH43/DUF377 family glycosyl hydrolase